MERMKEEMALRRRIATLVVTALLSVAGASVTAAASADAAQAAVQGAQAGFGQANQVEFAP
jgi:hypothetical protein